MRSSLVVLVAALALACSKGDKDGSSEVVDYDVDTTISADTTFESLVRILPNVTVTVAQDQVLTFHPGAGLLVEGTLIVEGPVGAQFVGLAAPAALRPVVVLANTTNTTISRLDDATFTDMDVLVTEDPTLGIAEVTVNSGTVTAENRTLPFSLSRATFTGNVGTGRASAAGRNLPSFGILDSTFTDYEIGATFYGTGDTSLQIDRTTFTNGRTAIQASTTGTLNFATWDDVTITTTTGTAVELEGITLNMDPGTISAAGAHGIESNSVVNLTNVTVTGSGDAGVIASVGGITNCDITDNVGDGVRFTDLGNALTDVTASNITGNGVGVRAATNVTLLDVLGNNLTDNISWAAINVRDMDGNFIRDNNGDAQLDVNVAGTLDGNRNTTTFQVENVDILQNPQITAIAGTGPN